MSIPSRATNRHLHSPPSTSSMTLSAAVCGWIAQARGSVRHFVCTTWWRLQHRFLRADAGQTTAEYALVLLGVAAIAILLLTWAKRTDTITRLFDAVLDSIIGRVE